MNEQFSPEMIFTRFSVPYTKTWGMIDMVLYLKTLIIKGLPAEVDCSGVSYLWSSFGNGRPGFLVVHL